MFARDGVIHRQINKAAETTYEHLMRSGLYDALASAGLLIPHSEVPLAAVWDERFYKVIRPEPIRFVSYPYEWCFGQLKAAALATLTIQMQALDRGMSLKDCSAYNIQFHHGRPVLIDTLSFEVYREGSPWIAYRQFCQHFLAPLALMSRVDVRASQLMRVHIDGVPLDLASKLLPAKTRLNLRLLLHLHLHALAIRRFAGSKPASTKRSMLRGSLRSLLDNLRDTVESLSWDPSESCWATYEQETNYSAEARAAKEDIVQRLLAEIRPRLLWDLGANVGRFSRLAARMGAFVVAFDADDAAIELNHRACQATSESNILPLVVDLTNPSPALGWNHDERFSWRQRGPADAVLALALVHHLAIGNNVPLGRLASFFADLGTHLIIEFVPKSDSQVQRLLSTREDVFRDYSREGFETAFSEFFHIVRSVAVDDSRRVMYLMRRR